MYIDHYIIKDPSTLPKDIDIVEIYKIGKTKVFKKRMNIMNTSHKDDVIILYLL